METVLSSLKVPTILAYGFTVNAVAMVVVGCVFALAYFAIRAPGFWSKVATVVLIGSTTTSLAFAMVEQLSHPKELSLSWIQEKGEEGIAVHNVIIKPPESIHMWVDIDGSPRAFWVQWNKQLEQSLKNAMKQWGDGTKGQLRFRFQPSLEKDPKFYLQPWPMPRPKDVPVPRKPYRFEQEA